MPPLKQPIKLPKHPTFKCCDCRGSGVVSIGKKAEKRCPSCGGRGHVPGEWSSDEDSMELSKPNVAKAIKSIAYVEIPEATLLDTGRAMVLAGLGEQLGLSIVDIVEQFPDKLLAAGLPAKLPPWVVKLALRIDRDARDSWLWRHQDRPAAQPREEQQWKEIKATEAKAKPAPAPVRTRTEPMAAKSIFDD